MSTIVFDVPLPLRDCSSNGDKGSWRKKSRAVKTYRQEGWCAFTLDKPAGYCTPDRVRMSLVFATKGARRMGRYAPRDISNALAAFKAAQDGIKDAGAMVDDDAAHCQLGSVTIDPGHGPWVRVTLEAIE